MQTHKYEGLLITEKKASKVTDNLVVEAALQININTKPYTVVMRTPGNDVELIRGLLYAEDIYKSKKPISHTEIERKENGFSIINITISKENLGKGYMNKRTLLSVSSCGICGKQTLDEIKFTGNKVTSSNDFDVHKISHMFNDMKKHQELFEKSGGSHAAAAFNKNQELIVVREDIGRHNAVDKVIGYLLNSKKCDQSKSLLVSGRVSYEIISKAFIANIPTVIAISACSTLAVDFAKELGISLIGFSRGNKSTIYS